MPHADGGGKTSLDIRADVLPSAIISSTEAARREASHGQRIGDVMKAGMGSSAMSHQDSDLTASSCALERMKVWRRNE